MPPLPTPNNAQARLDAISERLDRVEDIAVAQIQTLATNIEDKILRLEGLSKPIVEDLGRSVNAKLNGPAIVYNDIARTLYDHADQRLSNAYVDAQNLGAIYPTIEKVRQGNATGDYFASMDFDPTQLNNTPTAPPTLPPTTPILQSPLPYDTQPPVPPTTYGGDVPLGVTPTGSPPPTTPTVTSTQLPNVGAAGAQVGFGGVPACFMTRKLKPPNWQTGGGTTWCNGGCYYFAPRLADWATAKQDFSLQHPDADPNDLQRIAWKNEIAGADSNFQSWVSIAVINDGVPAYQLFDTRYDGPYISWDGTTGFTYIARYRNFRFAEECDAPPTPPPQPPPPLPPPTPPPQPPPPLPTNQCATGFATPNVDLKGGSCEDFSKILEGFGRSHWQIPAFFNLAMDPGTAGLLRSIPVIGPFAAFVAELPANVVQRFSCWLEEVVRSTSKDTNCNLEQLLPLAVYQGVLSMIEKYTGALPTPLLNNLEQAVNIACQSIFPGQGSADMLFNSGLITEPVWECYTKAIGNHVDPAKKVRDANRTQPTPHEWTVLYMRKYIDEDLWKQKLKELGVVKPDEVDRYKDLQIAWPHLDDVIRMMVRDVADPEIEKRFELSKDFELKWKQPLKRYGEALGITDEIAELYWKAHWRLASPTALFEMLHRLRPGRVPKEVEVSETDVEEALKQDDLLPFWVKRQMAISYSTMRLVDIRRAFMIEVIDEKELNELLQDRGYNKKDADLMTAFWVVTKEQADAKLAGSFKPANAVKDYVNRYITLGELKKQLNSMGIKEKAMDRMIFGAEMEQDNQDRRSVIKATQSLFTRGLISVDEMTSRLSTHNVPTELINQLAENWQVQIKTKSKEIPAASLCKMRALNIITPSQHLQGLMRVGYSGENASRISRTCEAEISEKERKAYERQQEKIKRELEKAKKEAEKRAKEAAKQAELNAV